MSKVIEGEFTEEKWDKKKIILGAITIAFLLYGGYYAKSMYLDPTGNNDLSEKTKVAGAQTQADEEAKLESTGIGSSNFSLPSTRDVQQQLEKLTTQVNKISVTEIASSSPQIQKVIKDLQSLENLPRSQAKQACEQICSNL